jgi:hypothetical protein
MQKRPGLLFLCIFLVMLFVMPPASAVDLMKPKHVFVYSSTDYANDAADSEKQKDYIRAWEYYREAAKKMKEEYDSAGKAYDSEYYRRQAIYCNKVSTNLHDLGQQYGEVEHSSIDRAEAAYSTAADQATRKYTELEAQKRTGTTTGCLITTATYGSPMAGEVQLVRDFRDNTISGSYLGSRYVTALNALYYSFSPAVARSIDDNPAVKPAMRIILAPLIGIVLLSQEIYSFFSFSPGIATVIFIIIGGALTGLFYILPVMLPILHAVHKVRGDLPRAGSLKAVAVLWAGLLAALAAGVVLANDPVTIISSGMLFVCTVLLCPAAASLYLLHFSADAAGRPS